MTSKKTVIAIASLMLIIGIAIGLGVAGLTWLNFVDNFSRMPFNQGLAMGATLIAPEILLQCPDIDVMKFRPEYYAAYNSIMVEIGGEDSILCWLYDTGSSSISRERLDCSLYDQSLERAKEVLQ